MRAKCFAMVFIWAAISSIAGLQILRADDVVPMQLKPPVATVDGTPVRGISRPHRSGCRQQGDGAYH